MTNNRSIINEFFNLPLTRRAFIDVDSIFDNMSHMVNQSAVPYNIIRTSDSTWVIEAAVAGYSKEDLKVELVDNILKISGTRKDYTGGSDTYKYEHRGITAKNFVIPISWFEGLKVGNASLENGMLRVVIERVESPVQSFPILDVMTEAYTNTFFPNSSKEESQEKEEINKVA
jgi:molecular chaperone IbpA